MKARFAPLEAKLADTTGGPWFGGADFTLVDAVFGPVFRYFDVLEGAGLRLLDDLPGIARWRTALADRPSVRDAVTRDYPDLLRAFLIRRGSHVSGYFH